MRKLSVSTLVALDGVIADPGGFGEAEYGGWANPYFSDDAMREAADSLRAADYFLLGRVTFELLYKAWGGQRGNPYMDRLQEIPKLVASGTLRGALPWNAEVIDGDVAAAVSRLKEGDGGGIEVYGSATLIQTLMRHDLVDEFRVAVHPLVLGHGRVLFPPGGVPARLRLAGSRTRDSGVVSLTYGRA
jgi:dihydrofolate reductase